MQGAPTPRTPRRGHGPAAGDSSRPTTPPAPTRYAPPGTKLLNPQLQARLLRIVASMLSQPGMTNTVLAACPQLPRLLLHMFAAAPVSAPPTGSASSSTEATDAAATQAAAAAGKAVPAAADGAKQGSQTPRSSLGAGVKGAGGPTQAGQLSGSGAGTPRKTPVSNAAPAVKVSMYQVLLSLALSSYFSPTLHADCVRSLGSAPKR